MTNLLMFPFDRVKRDRTPQPSAAAEIVIFNGVRIERRDFTAETSTAKPKRQRRVRQQAVQVQED